jgi:hypothetical protein
MDYRSPAYRALVKTLGESDATVEWMEVSVRELEELASNKPDMPLLLAAKHGIHVNVIDFRQLRTQSSRFQILAVYQQVEWFLNEFRGKHPRSADYMRTNDQDPLTATAEAFGVSKVSLGELEVDLFHHYRLAQCYHARSESRSRKD